MQIYIRSKSAQSHLKKSAFKDADKIRSDSTNKNQHDLGKLMFFSLTILPLPPPPKWGKRKKPISKSTQTSFLFPGQYRIVCIKRAGKRCTLYTARVSEHVRDKPERGQSPRNTRYWVSKAAAAFKPGFCFGAEKWCPEAATFASASLLPPPTQPLFPSPTGGAATASPLP